MQVLSKGKSDQKENGVMYDKSGKGGKKRAGKPHGGGGKFKKGRAA